MSRLNAIGTHKTCVYPDESGAVCVRYHKTVVARRHAGGLITLDSGGWHTRTTMLRMNQALRQWCGPQFLYVHQEKFEWYIGVYLGDGKHVRVGEYTDGMTLDHSAILGRVRP